MKSIAIKLLFAIIPFVLFSDNSKWKIQSSAIIFKVINAGATIEGKFSGLESEIHFNPLKPEEATIKASISAKTINTGMELRDNNLLKPDYFDVKKFPVITLQSLRIKKIDSIHFTGTFMLCIKNCFREITIPFTFIRVEDKTEFNAHFSINRNDYRLGGTSLTLAEDVAISINVAVSE